MIVLSSITFENFLAPPLAEFCFAKQAAATIMIPNNSYQKGTKMVFLHQMGLKIKVLKMCIGQQLPVSGK